MRQRLVPWLFLTVLLGAGCGRGVGPVTPDAGAPLTFATLERALAAYAETGDDPPGQLSSLMVRFRADASLAPSCFDRVFRPDVPQARTMVVLGGLTALLGPKFAVFMGERLEEFERRYQGQPARRAAILKEVQARGPWRDQLPLATARLLAGHEAQALEEAWLGADRTPPATRTFLNEFSGAHARFNRYLEPHDLQGRAWMAADLARLAAPLAEAAQQEQRELVDGGTETLLDLDTGLGPLESELINDVLQASQGDAERRLNRAHGPWLVKWASARTEVSATTVRRGAALRAADRELQILERLNPVPVVTNAVRAHWEMLSHVALAEVAAAALPALQLEADDVKEERRQLRCLRGTALTQLGTGYALPLARAAYLDRHWPASLQNQIGYFSNSTWPVSRREAQIRPYAAAMEMRVEPCHRPGLAPASLTAKRVLVFTFNPPPHGQSREFVVVAGDPSERPNADRQLEKWDTFLEKDLPAFDAFQATANADLAAATAILKREGAAAKAAEPRMRAAMAALRAAYAGPESSPH